MLDFLIMERYGRIGNEKLKYILQAFSTPKTPIQVVRGLRIPRFKLKPLLEKSLIVCLNPKATKGKLFVLTEKGRFLIDADQHPDLEKDWQMIGWILASPKQRLILLKHLDSVKRTSEDLRRRAMKSNPCLSRISTKAILSELINKELVESSLEDGKRYYWITQKGIKMSAEMDFMI